MTAAIEKTRWDIINQTITKKGPIEISITSLIKHSFIPFTKEDEVLFFLDRSHGKV
jgi:hypothetical protein